MTLFVERAVPGFIGRIPVRNIWLLLLYASQLYRELPDSERAALENAPDDIPALVAKILSNAVERRLRRNLSQGYQRREADLNRVRGRIDLFRTERRQLLQRARVACIFDELTVDTPRNRYVKAALTHIAAALDKLAKSPETETPRRESFLRTERRCRELALRLERVGVLSHLDSRQASKSVILDNVGWMDARERQMLAAARLALNLSIPTEESGSSLLPIANRQETQGWKLYEQAVAGFYYVVLSQHGWRVKHGSHIDWPLRDPTSGLETLMPNMITDIVLERRDANDPGTGQRIVIDTKFTSIVTSGQYGNQSLKSGNIYQLYAYLRSQENDYDALSRYSAGVLLYPSLGVNYDESATIQGHRIRFATVDLAADTQTIRKQLLRIVPGFSSD